MPMRPHPLIAYDAEGNVTHTLEYMVIRDEWGNVTGLIDFAAHEAAGGEHTDIWVADLDGDPSRIKGSKVWPEFLGSAFHQFRVELEGEPGKKRIAALVHRESGHRRERAVIEAKIEARIKAAKGKPADLRDLVGGPLRPMPIDKRGRNAPRLRKGTPAHLPRLGAGVSPQQNGAEAGQTQADKPQRTAK